MADPVSSSLRVIRALSKADDVPRGVIRAYHGSPHSFRRFDASKIGTGEGAQAYGHGLYFAGKEDVARTYRDIAPAVPSAEALESLRRIEDRLQKLRTEKSKLEFALEDAAEQGGFTAPGWGDIKSPPPEVLERLQPQLKAVNDELNALAMEQMQVRQGGRGHMYEVELGVPEGALLDLDAPVIQQSPAIQEMLGGYGRAPSHFTFGQEGWRGSNALFRARDNLGGSAEEASRVLLERGIPGVRYLDGDSRIATEGTRNYVMFPGTEDRIRILRQYGLLPPLLGAAALEDE
jgi:hypothetical protein